MGLRVVQLAAKVTNAVRRRCRGNVERGQRANALPLSSRKPLPESPGIPGVSVLTVCDPPPPVSPTLKPNLGDSCSTPPRIEELP